MLAREERFKQDDLSCRSSDLSVSHAHALANVWWWLLFLLQRIETYLIFVIRSLEGFTQHVDLVLDGIAVRNKQRINSKQLVILILKIILSGECEMLTGESNS